MDPPFLYFQKAGLEKPAGCRTFNMLYYAKRRNLMLVSRPCRTGFRKAGSGCSDTGVRNIHTDPPGGSDVMRVLVLSDTHGDVFSVRQALMSQPSAEVVFHLGDGAQDLMNLRTSFREKMFIQLRGNCDWGSSLPYDEEIDIEGVKIFAAHGHLYQVKLGETELLSAARRRGADIMLYGHTHVPDNRYEDGLYIFNPGSLHGYNGSYGYIDLTKQGIVTNIVKPGLR